MSRQPFITADLRPNVEGGEAEWPAVDASAGTEQLAEAARSLLSQEEQRQIERGNQQKRQELMAAVPRLSTNVQGTTLDGETVLLDFTSGRYYTLNRVGSAVWERCTGNESLHDIHTALCARYNASPERIADDLLALVTQLGHEGLLTLERR
ncbi:MAG: PqqD family protein [Nitrospira sp.]|nr:PqqD family protein [Nitrospira sp.]